MTNASSFSAKIDGGVLRVRLAAKPIEGAANGALLKELKRRGVKARILSGFKSREKELETDAASMAELEEKLR
ncbi:hypothetical protein AUJ16_04150 [Candidatus Micrarchaeota archaeon CG1_02_60_51]|nr:MAG: hypothetical protein AUJ16_04150 [Candidatus Micrarchaeota archaeon CG1_02_60_51]